MTDILKNLEHTSDRIRNACLAAGRNPAEVRLLLATKTVPPHKIQMALQAGYTLIAENKVQEVKGKYDTLRGIPHTTHFIGHLQTNKVKEILRYDVSCIQSVDRLRLAEKLDQRLAFDGKQIDVLIQVNTSGEESKFGVRPEETTALVQQVASLKNLRVRGLMTIGLFSSDTEQVRSCFRLLRQLKDQLSALKIPGVDMKELSMGMSGDLETAIEEGATIVRVGTAIFGKRKYPDSYYWNEGSASK